MSKFVFFLTIKGIPRHIKIFNITDSIIGVTCRYIYIYRERERERERRGGGGERERERKREREREREREIEKNGVVIVRKKNKTR